MILCGSWRQVLDWQCRYPSSNCRILPTPCWTSSTSFVFDRYLSWQRFPTTGASLTSTSFLGIHKLIPALALPYRFCLDLWDGMLRRDKCLRNIPECVRERYPSPVIEPIAYARFDNIAHDALIWKVWHSCRADMKIVAADDFGRSRKYPDRLWINQI